MIRPILVKVSDTLVSNDSDVKFSETLCTDNLRQTNR